MTDYMVEGLVKRRAAIAGEMKALQARLAQAARDDRRLSSGCLWPCGGVV